MQENQGLWLQMKVVHTTSRHQYIIQAGLTLRLMIYKLRITNESRVCYGNYDMSLCLSDRSGTHGEMGEMGGMKENKQ